MFCVLKCLQEEVYLLLIHTVCSAIFLSFLSQVSCCSCKHFVYFSSFTYREANLQRHTRPDISSYISEEAEITPYLSGELSEVEALFRTKDP